MISDPTNSFKKLRPVCVKLANEPSIEVVRELKNISNDIEAEDLSQLLEYTIFPLKLLLQAPSHTQELKQAAVECIQAVLARSEVNKPATFEDIFTLLCVLLSRKEPDKVADLSEELKSSIVCCIKELFDCSTLIVKSCLYSPRFLPALGHSVTLLLCIAENERSKALKINAVACLWTIAFCSRDAMAQLSQPEAVDLWQAVRNSASHAFASFIPGISMSLCRVITSDSLQKHSVITVTIDTWGDILVLVMNDECFPRPVFSDTDDITTQIANLSVDRMNTNDSHSLQDQKFVSENNGVINKAKSLAVDQDVIWFKKTAMNLKILVEKSVTVVDHLNWQVRLALAQFAKKLLLNCTDTMQNCVPALVKVLITLVTDEFEQVSSEARIGLEEFSKCKLKDGVNSLKSLLQEHLHSLLMAIPRLIRTAGDSQKLQSFGLVKGYLRILGPNICGVLNSVAHLKRLSLALVQVLEFDLSDVRIVEERTPSMMETAVLPSDTSGQNPLTHSTQVFVADKYPKYRFKHFSDDKIYNSVVQICQLLGCYGNLPLLVDHFLDLFHESVTHQKQAVFILNEIIRGYSGMNLETKLSLLSVGDKVEAVSATQDRNRSDSSELESVVQLLLSVYLYDGIWNTPTANPSDNHTLHPIVPTRDLLVLDNQPKKIQSNRGMSFETLNSNIHLSCLLLESIGVLASSLGPQFKSFLIESIYPVMARLGNENAAVSRSAYGTLVLICQNCNYRSVEEFICCNSDYLVNAIAMNFKFVFMDEQAPKVLQVMIQYSNSGILPIIEDTLMDIFAVIDTYPDQLLYQLMTVLNTLVHAIKRWFHCEQSTEGPRQVTSDDGQESPQQETEKEGTELIDKALPEEICQFFLDYHKRKQMALGEIDVDTTDDVDSAPEGPGDEADVTGEFEEDKRSEIPVHVKYVKEVLEKCIHFLSSKSVWLRLLVLDNVEAGVLALQQSQNELLPMIHRLWPPLVRRLSDTEQVVTSKAVAVLCTMAEVSGDFMRRRVIKDALPPLKSFLNEQSSISAKAGPVYSHTQAYKLQLVTIEGLGRLCMQLGIAETDLSQVAETCMKYLSARQPPQLQTAAVKAFEKFVKMESDAMWLTLNDLYCPIELERPHDVFKQVQMAGSGSEHKEYEENVKFLLRMLEEPITVNS